MKSKLILLVVLALALPLAAFADNDTFTTSGGTLTGNDTGFVLTGAELTSVNGITGNLGTVSFSTGVLGPITNVNGGGPFNAGGTITIIGNGTNGVGNGVLLNGTFSQGTWTATTLPDGTSQYVMSAVVTGSAGSSDAVGQYTVSVNTGTQAFSTVNNQGGTTGATSSATVTVPEPGELSLFGTGLLGLAGIVRRKLNVKA